MTTNKPEVVAYRYTASRSFGKRNQKWHYQETFPHVENRKVEEIGRLEDLIRLSDYEALQADYEKLRKEVAGLLICDECHDKCADPYTGLFTSHCPDEEPCIMCECSSLRRQLASRSGVPSGLPSAEHLKSRVNELEAELATARAGWQETIAKTASHERPAYDEQQQRIAKLEAINLGLTRTLVELHAEQAKLVEALDQCITSMLDSGYRTDAVVIQAARAALAAHRKGGEP